VYMSDWADDLPLKKWMLDRGWLHGQGTSVPIAQRQQAIERRSAAKKQITRDLIEGRRTLFEAAAAFRLWNEDYPRLPDPFLPGDSVEERLCRQVIEWVRMTKAEGNPGSVELFCETLEQELRRHIEQNGKVILPDAVTK
jgi:hypothetical protein